MDPYRLERFVEAQANDVHARAVLSHPDRTARQVMGSPDDAKLRSSMTLFALATDAEPVFQQVLDTFFTGQRDPRTLALLGG